MTFESKRRGLRPAWLVAGSSAWMATLANIPLWRELGSLSLLDRPSGWLLAAALAVLMAALLAALTSLLAWRGTLKPVILLLLAASALGSYFMLTYRIVIDSTMLVNVLQTDRREALALFSPRLLVVLFLLAVVPGWLVWRTDVRYAPWPRQMLRNLLAIAVTVAAAAGVLLLSFQPLSSAMRNHKQLRYLMNPLASVYALGQLVAKPLQRGPGRTEPLGRDAALAWQGARPPLLVLVLGETGRAGNFSLNGYPRPTTPELAARDVVSWRNAWSCGTSTAASVPCMFSHLGRQGYDDRKADSENLLDVLQHAGLAVLWIDNQAGCKGVCERVPNARVSDSPHPTLCPDGECLDAILLEGIDQRIAQLPAERRARGVVLVLHQMGSHGPAYARRSPAAFKRFLPECTSVNLQDCSRDEVVNAYDNTIAYTDHVLASTVDWLKRRQADYDTAMLYVADHGESLGENNLYLHGLPYGLAPDVQKRVPWITWLSPGFERDAATGMQCLRGRAERQVSHDNYFHSVLGLLRVRTAAYRAELDAYAGCAPA
ncbi:MAG: phosphoethanolamine--lipid A transferase [Pseudomonadota bacterium]